MRVPSDALRNTTPDRIRIDVFTMKARPERAQLSPAPLQDQFGSEARLVARLDGLAPERMEPRVRVDLERALRQH